MRRQKKGKGRKSREKGNQKYTVVMACLSSCI